MALILADDTVDIFQQTSRFDLTSYVLDWHSFASTDYPKIVNFYNGTSDTLDKDAARNLANIRKQTDILEDVVLNVQNNFNRMDFWNLIEFIDEINTRLKVISRIDKFMRSVKYNGINESSIAISYTASDADTPEGIAAKDRSDPQNDWTDIYIKNRILETDYLAEQGGYEVVLGRKNLPQVNLQSVVDNLVGTNVYGKDLDTLFVFEDDDLRVLSPRDTVRQAILTLARLQKGDVPEFLSMGVSPDLVIGSNIGVLSVPFLVREMVQTFQTDDTLLNFRINNVEVQGSSLFVEFEVETFYNYIINDNLEIR